MLRVEKLLSHLLARGLISCLIGPEDARKAVEDSDSWQISQSFGIMLLQSQEIQQICGPAYKDGYIDVIFDNAVEWLVFTLVVNFLLCPECFDFENIQSSAACHGAAVGRLGHLHDYPFWMFSFLCLN